MPVTDTPITDPTKWEYRRLKLNQLVTYAAQDYFHANTTKPIEDEALQQNLKSGQRDPIHVMPPKNAAGLPPYTILDGHRRKKGMMANGEVRCKGVIRHDLVDADAATMEGIFLDFSDHRNLHPIIEPIFAGRLAVSRCRKPDRG